MQCHDLKLEHDACFYQWYWHRFLPGTADPQQPCEPQFRAYRACLEDKFKDAPTVLERQASHIAYDRK